MKTRVKLVALGAISLALLGAWLLNSPPSKRTLLHVGQHRAPHAGIGTARQALEPNGAPTSVIRAVVEGSPGLGVASAPAQLEPTMTAYQRSFIEPALDVLEQFQRRSELTGNATIAVAIERERANLSRAAAGLPTEALPVER